MAKQTRDLTERVGDMAWSADAAREYAEVARFCYAEFVAAGPAGDFGDIPAADLALAAARECLTEAANACRAAAGMEVWAADEPLDGVEPAASAVSRAAGDAAKSATLAAVFAHYLWLLAKSDETAPRTAEPKDHEEEAEGPAEGAGPAPPLDGDEW